MSDPVLPTEPAAPPKGAPVAVLSHGLWQRRYGGDPGILGRKVLVDGVDIAE